MLMAGNKSESGRGAECVISNFQDLYPIVMYFNQCYSMEGNECLENSRFAKRIPESVTSAFKGKFWISPQLWTNSTEDSALCFDLKTRQEGRLLFFIWHKTLQYKKYAAYLAMNCGTCRSCLRVCVVSACGCRPTRFGGLRILAAWATPQQKYYKSTSAMRYQPTPTNFQPIIRPLRQQETIRRRQKKNWEVNFKRRSLWWEREFINIKR